MVPCQRWREHRSSYRPAGEPIRTELYEVSEIPGDAVAKAFVERHHYEHSFPAARARFGLYRGDELVGVAVLSVPASEAALDSALPFESDGRAELGRFVLLDDVPANGESWFLARCFELARRKGFEAIVAHSDPEPRLSCVGDRVFAGHIGNIYQATNARYVGKTPARTRRMLPDGSVFSDRVWSKLRAREKGWDRGVELLLEYGAPPVDGEWREWLKRAVHATTKPFRHRGNHRYLWALDRRVAKHFASAQQYPKAPFALCGSAPRRAAA